MNNKEFLRDLQQRGVNPYVWNGCVKWHAPSGVLSKPEKHRLRRLRYAVAAMRVKESAATDGDIGVDIRWPPTLVSRNWSWKPPREPYPVKVIFSRENPPADRKRSEATKTQPRTEDGQFGETVDRTGSAATRHSDKGREARAAASGTNRGAVERMDKLDEKRPKGQAAPPDELWWQRTLGKRYRQVLERTS